MRRLLFPALCIALAAHAHALTDTNANGLSDDWEKAFNGGQLFSAANADHLSTADPDGDGWTNLQEATAGTDPFDSLPPSGIFMPSIAITPATYEPLPVGYVPPPSTEPTDPFAPAPPAPPSPPRILLDPAEIRLTWQPVPGKTYRALLSPDLLSWSPASGTYVGGNDPITYETVPLHEDGTVPEKLFWRVETGDTDSDGDTISDYEEILRNLDPLSRDSDGDGLPDNSDPAPLVNSLQAVWDADSVDPSAAPLFAAFNFTPPATGSYPFTAERVTDISGNNRHGKARTQFQTTPPEHNAPQDNAEGIANHGFRFANAHHYAFDLVNPGINFAPVASLSFWLKAKAADLEGNGQPVFSYVPKLGVFAQNPNSANPYAARAFLRKQPVGTGYEVVWLDWTFPGNIVRERWTLDLTAPQLEERWINLTFVWQGGSGASQSSYWACYANGVKQIRTLNSSYRFQATPTTPNTPQDTFVIGADAAGGTGQNNLATIQSTFKGAMDRVRIYTAALTPAQILAIAQQDTDNDGLWDATEAAATAWKDTNGNGRRDIGEIFYPNGSPIVWQHSGTDSDSDGITDILEQNATRTDPYNHDSDNDLLPDGWETQYNLNPNSSTGIDGQTGDPDIDGVDNFREWQHLTNPRLADSDGDIINDATEIAQGSNPNSGGDNGQAPPPEETLTLKIIVGDPSTSHSERWRVEATEVESGQLILRHASRQYGQVTTAAESTFNKFKPGKAYSFQLIHAGTDPDKLATDPERISFPDYDWTLQISYKNADGTFSDVTDPAQTRYLLLDPYNGVTKSLSEDSPNLLAPEAPWGTIGNGSPATLTYRYDMLPARVVMLPLGITPDANRDGKIDLADRDKITPGKPWRFWTNDDDDSGATGGTDIPQPPGTPETNGYDHRVNGVRDLIDFFPLDLNLQAALKIFPEGKYRYKLTHVAPQSAPCFRIVQATNMNPASAGAYLKDLDTADTVSALDSLPIHSVGRSLNTTFLRSLEHGQGLLLVEAVRPTTEPIRLAIIRSSDQTMVGEVSLPVSVTSVKDMYRWKFVSPGAADLGQGDIPGDPPNWPDGDRNGKHFVFVHGYNVNPEQSKGWAGEAFKRLFWCGSEGRFSAFAWYGYQSQVELLGRRLTPDYQVNLAHMFGAAKSFKQFIDLLEGEKTVAAHSMGNILVGSAMHDWNARPKNYIMLNSSAAKECYDGTEADNSDQNTLMVHPAWAAYPKELRASEWHKLAWPADDKRRLLTWRNRLRGVIDNGGLTDVYQFYSTGEEVLNNAETNNPSIDTSNPFGITELGWLVANKTWAMQEKRKGFGLTGYVHTSDHGGWLPNLLPYHVDLHVVDSGPWGAHRMRMPSELPPSTDAAWLAKLRSRPFFNTSYHANLYDAQTGAGSIGSDYAAQHRDALLGAVIPCTSLSAGRNNFLSTLTALPTNRQIDMDTTMKTDEMRWPLSNENENGLPPSHRGSRPWLHSDIREKAFIHNRKVYEKFVEIGNLKQEE